MHRYDDARDAEQEAALEKAKQDRVAIERDMQCQFDKLEQEMYAEFPTEIEAEEEVEWLSVSARKLRRLAGKPSGTA
jgi:hypothetical protein